MPPTLLLYADAIWWAEKYPDACASLLSSRDDAGFPARDTVRAHLQSQGWQRFMAAWAWSVASDSASAAPSQNALMRANDTAMGGFLACTSALLDAELQGGARATAQALPAVLDWMIPNVLRRTTRAPLMAKAAILGHLRAADIQLGRVLALFGDFSASLDAAVLAQLAGDLVRWRIAIAIFLDVHSTRGGSGPGTRADRVEWQPPINAVADLLADVSLVFADLPIHDSVLRAGVARGLTRASAVLDTSAVKHPLNVPAATASTARKFAAAFISALMRDIGEVLCDLSAFPPASEYAIARLADAGDADSNADYDFTFMKRMNVDVASKEAVLNALTTCVVGLGALAYGAPASLAEWRAPVLEAVSALYAVIYAPAIEAWSSGSSASKVVACAALDGLLDILAVLSAYSEEVCSDTWQAARNAVLTVLEREANLLRRSAGDAKSAACAAWTAGELLSFCIVDLKGRCDDCERTAQQLQAVVQAASAYRTDLTIVTASLFGLREIAALAAHPDATAKGSALHKCVANAMETVARAAAAPDTTAVSERAYASAHLMHPVIVAAARACIASAARATADACRYLALEGADVAAGANADDTAGALGAHTPHDRWPKESATYAICNACFDCGKDAAAEVVFDAFAHAPVLPLSSRMLAKMRQVLLEPHEVGVRHAVLSCMQTHAVFHAPLRHLADDALAALMHDGSLIAHEAGIVATCLHGASAATENSEVGVEETAAAVREHFVSRSESAAPLAAWPSLSAALASLSGSAELPLALSVALGDATRALVHAAVRTGATQLGETRQVLAELALQGAPAFSTRPEAFWAVMVHACEHLIARTPTGSAMLEAIAGETGVFGLHLHSLVAARLSGVPWPPSPLSPNDVIATLCSEATWPAWMSVSLAASRVGANVRCAMIEAAAARAVELPDPHAAHLLCALIAVPHAATWTHSPSSSCAALVLCWPTCAATLGLSHRRKAALALKRVRDCTALDEAIRVTIREALVATEDDDSEDL